MKKNHYQISTIPEFNANLLRYPNFTAIKINHGFWEALSRVDDLLGWPVKQADHRQADEIAKRKFFFEGGFVDELLTILKGTDLGEETGLYYGASLLAWPDSYRIEGTPQHFEKTEGFLQKALPGMKCNIDPLLMKSTIHDGSFAEFLKLLQNFYIIVVGPEIIVRDFLPFANLTEGDMVPIHPTEARRNRFETEELIKKKIQDVQISHNKPPIVLLQAGTLAPYWALRLRSSVKDCRIVDLGLALSICHPEDIFSRPWGKVYYKEIATFYNQWVGEERIQPTKWINLQLPAKGNLPVSEKINFIENKIPNWDNVKEYLALSERENHWTNFGPLSEILEEKYRDYLGLSREEFSILVCSNCTIGLELIARLLEYKAQRKLRWVVSAFSFENLRIGFFNDAQIIDCDSRGMLSMEELKKIPLNAYDGVVLTNIYGLHPHFREYERFCRQVNKHLILDNAAGLGNHKPEHFSIPYHAFSLHQTKPFGVGEGGLIVTPAEDREQLKNMMFFAKDREPMISPHATNAKISEISSAFLLDRLIRSPEWEVLYQSQYRRILTIVTQVGLTPFVQRELKTIAMSIPFIAKKPVALTSLVNDILHLGKYYQPIKTGFPQADQIYDHIVNIPCHPDVAKIETKDLVELMKRFV